MTRRLWVVDPSKNHPEDQGVAEIVDGWGGSVRLFRPALAGDGPSPDTGYATDGVVLMGSAVSVHDDEPWLGALSAWLGPLLAGEPAIPVLGICFGHQLIGHLAGGEVGLLSPGGEKRLGVEQSTLEGGRLVPGRHRLRVVVSHREEIKRLPPGYRTSATREGVAIDGLEHECRPVYGFQFHPEARDEFARTAGIPAGEIDDRLRADSRRVLAAFRERVGS